jgi:hypothetical protein
MIRDRVRWPSPAAAIAAVALFAALGTGGTLAAASGGESGAAAGAAHLTVAAPAFVPVQESTHNNMASSVCGTFVPSQPGSENKGDLNAMKGSFLAPVSLPDGATVNELTVFANDNDAGGDVHVFLLRKLLRDGLSPQFNGYRRMASVASNGAVLNTMREFTESTIQKGTIDNGRYEYFLELVNCAVVEPFAARIGYSTA